MRYSPSLLLCLVLFRVVLQASNRIGYDMIGWLHTKLFEQSVTEAYSVRLKQQGSNARGVFWASRLSQYARFDHALLLLQAKWHNKAKICDIGCGYGALYEFMAKTPRYQALGYHGIDINKDMVAACFQLFGHTAPFSCDRKPPTMVDVGVYIGTFNLCHANSYTLWQYYILNQLRKSWDKCRFGIVLNITSKPSPQIHNQIFYAEPKGFAELLKQHFGQSVHIQTHSTRYVDNDSTFVISRR